MSTNSTSHHHHHTDNSGYGYTPTLWICILFVVLYSLSCIAHTLQALIYRKWWMIPTMTLGCIGEIIGWSGRLWSSQNVKLLDPFLMQISTTVVSPSFMSAANFTILSVIIGKLGNQYAWLTPKWYIIIFVVLDVVSLVIQSVGGSQASHAAQTDQDPNPGGKVMLYGIVMQLIALTIYVILGTDFIIRFLRDKPVRKVPVSDEKTAERPMMSRNTRLMLIGLVLNSLFLFIRAIYRIIELHAGWDGSVITNQSLFNWLDGAQITMATYTFNILHPGYLLRDEVKMGSKEVQESKDTL